MFNRRLFGKEEIGLSMHRLSATVLALLVALGMLFPISARAEINCPGDNWDLDVSFFVGKVNGVDVATMQYNSAAKPDCPRLNEQVILTLPTPEELDLDPLPADEWYEQLFEDAVDGPLALNSLNFTDISVDFGTMNINVADADAAELVAISVFQSLLVEHYVQFYPDLPDFLSTNGEKSCAVPLIGQSIEQSDEQQVLSGALKVAKGLVKGAKVAGKIAKRGWKWATSRKVQKKVEAVVNWLDLIHKVTDFLP